MPHTLIRVFNEIGQAARAREALLSEGFSVDEVQLDASEDEAGTPAGNFVLPRIDTPQGRASGADVSDQPPAPGAKASTNTQAVTRGHYILTVEAGDDQARERAAAIVAPYGARDPA